MGHCIRFWIMEVVKQMPHIEEAVACNFADELQRSNEAACQKAEIRRVVVILMSSAPSRKEDAARLLNSLVF